MVMFVDPLPPLLDAVTKYEVDDEITVGVPQIVPLLTPKFNPVGRLGVIDQDVAGSPIAVGVTEVIGVPFVNVSELGEYEIEDGGVSSTSIVNIAVALPPVFWAVTV
tara:strand:+ start:1856 stop:2176 length:321 start_codon:yes stop_codon:yes gene_type:complete